MRHKSISNLSFGISFIAMAIVAVIVLAIAAGPGAAGQTATTSAGKRAVQEPRPAVPTRVSQLPRGRIEKPMDGLFEPLFLPAVTFDSGGDASAVIDSGPVAVADLDGDGKLDMVVPIPCYPVEPGCDGRLNIFLGNGDGTFRAAGGYDSGASLTTWVAIADVNNDNKPDLIVANTTFEGGGTDGPGVISVLLGNGDGTFRPAVTFDTGGWGATSVAVGDFNRDGKPDLAVTNNSTADSGEGSIGVLLGNGDGTFQTASSYDSGMWGARSVAISDLNHDGKLDVVFADVCSPANGGCNGKGLVGVLLGNGDGTFQPVVTYDSGDYLTNFMVVADLNHDGVPDAVTVGSTGIGVLLGNGDGTFQPAVTYRIGGYYGGGSMVAVADVDGDGRPDVVSATSDQYGYGIIDVLIGNGDGTLQAAESYDPGAVNTWSVVAADLTGHHRQDLIFTECANPECGRGDSLVGLMLHVGSVTTKTQAVSSLNPAIFGQAVTFTATVSSASGTPSGTVEFFDNTTLLATETLTNGGASLTLPNMAAGSHPITALYQGTLTYNSSLSPTLNQVVNVATTTTSLTTSVNPVLVRHQVAYTATVTTQAGGPITGYVLFNDNGDQFGIDLVGNQAVAYAKYKTNGIHTVTATYPGDGNNASSSSAPVTEYVQGSTATHLTTSGSPSQQGQPVTFTATVTSKFGKIPDGELVTFFDSKKQLGSVPLSGGIAAFTTSSLSVKTHTIKAAYAGDPIFKSSAGHVTQVVKGN